MADSFTTRNRGRKPESGQHANAWAALANEDLISDRQDEALDGVQSYTLSGSKVLTSNNGEVDEARMRVQNITGGTGGTVTIPDVQKMFIGRAGSSGDVIFANSSNSVAVKAGNIVPIFTDGTNIYQSRCLDYGSDLLKSTGAASDPAHLVNLATLQEAILNAELSGGELTLGAGVSAALATAVGSAGSIVTNGGALGTPSSGNLANCTGIVLGGIGGLGTGVATALAGNVGSAGAVVVLNGALGTPASATLTNATGLPIAGITFLDIDGTLAANSDAKVPSQKAVKTYVDATVSSVLKYKGATDCSGNPNYPAASAGWAYVVTVAGKIGGASGVSVDAGDMYFAIADNAGGTQASVGTSWRVLEHNLAGALLSANNLSDLLSAATARANLGVSAGAISFVIDGGGEAITTGIKGETPPFPYPVTITSVTLTGDQTGSIVIDIWKDSYANFPPVDGDSITASAPPTISSSNKSRDTTLTDWTTAVATDGILRFNVDSCTSIQRVTVTVGFTR